MSSPSAVATWRVQWICLPPGYKAMCALLLVALAIRLPYLGDPAACYDEQLYSFVGSRMLEGAVPYLDIWDRKPFGLFLLFAAIHWIGGPEAIAYQVAALVFAAFGGWLVYRIALTLGDGFGALLCGVLYVIGLTVFAVHAGQSEVFYLPLAIGMLVVMVDLIGEHDLARLRRRSAAIMMMGGVLLQFKYTALPQCMFFGAGCMWLQWRAGADARSLAFFAATACVLGIFPTLVVAAYYAWLGAFDAFFYSNFLSIFERGKLSSDYLWHFGLLVAIGAAPFLALALGGVATARRNLSGREWGIWSLIALWTLANIISFVMLGSIYIHYFAPAMPGLVLIAAPFLGRGHAGRITGLVMLALLVVFTNLDWRISTSQSNRAAIEQITAVASPHVDRNRNCLYVFDGPTALYRTTNSCLPTRYVYPDHLSNSMETNSIGTDSVGELRRILASRPTVIITASKPIVPRYNPEAAKLIHTAVARDYRRVGSVPFFPRLLHVNVRRDLIAATAGAPESKTARQI